MGFYVTASIEHDGNSYDNFYVRIENYNLQKPLGSVKAVINHYKDKAGALKAIPEYIEDIHVNNGEDMFRMVHKIDGVEKTHEYMHDFPITEEETVTVTTYSSSISTQEIEFTDFDDDGNEVTKTRTQEIETIHTGSANVVKNKVNLNLITGSIYPWVYERVINEYAKIYGSENINNA
tara:strand:- start:2740 stop:3273 length:534 start_codon:yes stop_codon:yes gene_type:complete